MRLFVLLLMLALPNVSSAAFRIAVAGCVKPGQTVTISGAGFSARPSGSVQLSTKPKAVQLQPRSWSSRQIKVVFPKSGVAAGSTADVVWARPGAGTVRLGKVTLCGSAASDRTAGRTPNRQRAGKDVVAAPDKSPEYVVLVSPSQSTAATNALAGQGAQLLRTRGLPRLGRTMLFFAFPGDLSLARARGVLGTAAPSAQVDVHHIYGYAAGPRLYAAALVGDDPGKTCKLRRAVRVGLIDSPVNGSHPALAGVSVSRYSPLGAGQKKARPDHGTAVAALIGGRASAGPLAGFASGARLYSVEAFSTSKGKEGARLEDVSAGLDWLIGKNVTLVNLSMSGAPNQTFSAILSLAGQKGLILVAAAGNNGSSSPKLPAASKSTIAVTAVDAAGRVFKKANSGSHLEFAAPGVDLYVAKGSGGGYRSGTSYAAPIVTAAIARMLARGAVSLGTARNGLKSGVRDLGPAGRDARFGYGLIQTGGC